MGKGTCAKETFPKIASACTISNYKKTKKGVEPKFKDLIFVGHQIEQLDVLIDEELEVTVTIQQKQGSLLPKDSDKGMAATVAKEEAEEQ